MTDFWRLLNALIIVVIVLLALFWGFKHSKSKPGVNDPATDSNPDRLIGLKTRKQKLASDLAGYEQDIAMLEIESRQMVDDCLAEQEALVNRLVREESCALLDEMHAAAAEALKAEAQAVKANFARRLDEQDN